MIYLYLSNNSDVVGTIHGITNTISSNKLAATYKEYSGVSEILSPLVLFKIDHNRGLTVILSHTSTKFCTFVL